MYRVLWRLRPMVLSAALVLTLTGCVSPTPSAMSTRPPSAASTAGPRAEDPARGSDPRSKTEMELFDATNRATLAHKPNAAGGDFVAGLRTADFAEADMQVTADTTTIGLTAPSVQFSVRVGNACLIGENGGTGGYVSEQTAVLSTGKCLIGATRSLG